MRQILIVAATQKRKAQFERDTLLGFSLRRMAFDRRITSAIAYNNKHGLPAMFNRQIVEANRNKILVFTHDDVRIDDHWFSQRLDEGLCNFDIIGVAGNRRLTRHHSGWAFDSKMKWDIPQNLTGAVCHITPAGEAVSFFGESGQRCKLLDGVLLAVNAAVLLDCGLRFDEKFAFHFYDLDFCRSAADHGLALGTWPIAVTHASGGSFGSPAWERAFQRYREKWS
jgi:GT2 family glycosyltransferase